MFGEGDEILNDKKLTAQAAEKSHKDVDGIRSESDTESVDHDGRNGGELPQTKARSGSVYDSLDISNNLSPSSSFHEAPLNDMPPPPPIIWSDSSDNDEQDHKDSVSPVEERSSSIDMLSSDVKDQKEESFKEDSAVEIPGNQAVQTQLFSAALSPNAALTTFLQRITEGKQLLLLTNGEASSSAPSEESILLEKAESDVVSKELSSDYLLYSGAVVGFVSGPAIRCLNDYVSGNKDKACADHYYATFSTTNLFHIASSYVSSSVFRAAYISSFDKNDYLGKKYPFALGLAYTAGYDVLDLSVSLLKSGNSEDNGSDL